MTNIMYQLPTGELMSPTPDLRIRKINNPNIGIGLLVNNTFIPLGVIRRFGGNLNSAMKELKKKKPAKAPFKVDKLCDRCQTEQAINVVSPDGFVGKSDMLCDRCYDDVFKRSNANICYAGLS